MARVMMIVMAISLLSSAKAVAISVVTNGVQLSPGGFSGDYSFILHRDPSLQGLYTGVEMDFSRDATTGEFILTGRSSYTDEGSNWYLVEEGDILSSTAVATKRYPLVIGVTEGEFEFNSVSFLPPLLEEAGIFPREFFLGIGPPSSAWGWAKLGISSPASGVGYGLILLDSALFFHDRPLGGVIVGSHTIVPEPRGVVGIVVLGALALSFGRRFR